MKTKEELNELKEEIETLNKKLEELTEEELKQVTGGGGGRYYWESNKPLEDGEKPIDGGSSWGPHWGE